MMNETMKNLLTRRSCKKYKDEEIPKEIIDSIIECGKAAPSGKGLQSAIIIAVTNKETRDMLSRENAKILGTDIDPFYGAPVVLVVLAKKDVFTHVYDGSLVMGNMLNAAASLGMGACWIHRAKEMFETDPCKQLLKDLGIEEEYEGIGNMVLGYADGDPIPARPRKDNYVYYVE